MKQKQIKRLVFLVECLVVLSFIELSMVSGQNVQWNNSNQDTTTTTVQDNIAWTQNKNTTSSTITINQTNVTNVYNINNISNYWKTNESQTGLTGDKQGHFNIDTTQNISSGISTSNTIFNDFIYSKLYHIMGADFLVIDTDNGYLYSKNTGQPTVDFENNYLMSSGSIHADWIHNVLYGNWKEVYNSSNSTVAIPICLQNGRNCPNLSSSNITNYWTNDSTTIYQVDTSKRVLIGGATDDGTSALHVNGAISNYNAGTGLGTIINADGSIGYGAYSAGVYSIALGYGAYSEGFGSTAIGVSASSGGYSSTALGYGAYSAGDGSFALGNGAYSGGVYSTAIGIGVSASADYSTTIGSFNSYLDNPVANSMVLGGYSGSADEAWLTLNHDNANFASTQRVLIGGGTDDGSSSLQVKSKFTVNGSTKLNGNLNVTQNINTQTNFSVNNLQGLTKGMTIVKSVDLVGLTKVMCDLNFTGGILTSTTC